MMSKRVKKKPRMCYGSYEVVKVNKLYQTAIKTRSSLDDYFSINIAGETSSGKTTLVNKILEKKILITRNAQSTSTVCKIRNSGKIKIIAKHASGQTIEKDLTDKCDINNTEGEKLLRDTLKTFTDIGLSQESKEYQSVDIGLPIPMLKVIE